MRARFLSMVFGKPTPCVVFACAALLVGATAGCGGGGGESAGEETLAAPPEPGSFQAEVRGALTDTLHGAATARFDSTGRLVGLELNDAADTTRAGLSFELAARPGRQKQQEKAGRTYVVAQREGGREDTSFTLMNAYLRLRGNPFAAHAGSLRVRRDSTGAYGRFGLRLRGDVEAASDEQATVVVRGRFREASSSTLPAEGP